MVAECTLAHTVPAAAAAVGTGTAGHSPAEEEDSSGSFVEPRPAEAGILDRYFYYRSNRRIDPAAPLEGVQCECELEIVRSVTRPAVYCER